MLETSGTYNCPFASKSPPVYKQLVTFPLKFGSAGVSQSSSPDVVQLERQLIQS